MPAVLTRILAPRAAPADERNPVAQHHAFDRMTDDVAVAWLTDKGVTAMACVLRASGPLADMMDAMAEHATEIADPLPEEHSIGVRILLHAEEERVPAACAGVFGMAVASANPLVRVMAEETGERMPDADRGGSIVQACCSAAGAVAAGSREDFVVNSMSPNGTQ
jgi:hypothetical protein